MKIIARAKIDACAVLLKKSTGFCRMSITTSLLCLGALLRDNLQIGAFSWHRCMFLLTLVSAIVLLTQVLLQKFPFLFIIIIPCLIKEVEFREETVGSMCLL